MCAHQPPRRVPVSCCTSCRHLCPMYLVIVWRLLLPYPILCHMEKQSVRLEVDGLGIAGMAFLPAGPGPHPVLCVSHGLPAGPPDPNDQGYQSLAERCCGEGFATMIFNFRGAGQSEGNMDMLGWCRDLAAVVERSLSLPRVDPGRVNLLGFSAGAAVSVYVAAHDRRVTAVACSACPAKFRFPSTEKAQEFLAHLREIGLVRDPGFPASVEDWMAGFSGASPLKWVEQVSPRPLLLLHGDRDEVVPLESAHSLMQKAGEPKELQVIAGAGHRLRRDPRAMDAALAWLKRTNHLA